MRARRDGAAAVAASASIFSALGDATRLRLVTRLCHEGPLSVSTLTEGEKVTRQAVAKHLRVLEGAGLVRGTREGRESVWSLETARLEVARRHLERVSQRWDDALERLRAHVEVD